MRFHYMKTTNPREERFLQFPMILTNSSSVHLGAHYELRYALDFTFHRWQKQAFFHDASVTES